MKKFILKNNTFFTTLIFFSCAKVFIFLAHIFSFNFFPQNNGFLAASRYANFDGVHYLAIAENNYEIFQQAFFPLFPLLIHFLNKTTGFSFVDSGLILSNLSFFLFLYFFQKFLGLRYKKENVLWIVIAFLCLPMSFFMQTVYTEPLFLLLLVIALFSFQKEKYLLAFSFCGLLTAVRLNGILLTIILLVVFFLTSKNDVVKKIPLIVLYLIVGSAGLLSYMYFLGKSFGDPILFVHVQEAFGANRTTESIVLLPQVLFRYIKIFLSVSPLTLTFWVSITEFVAFITAMAMCIFSLKKTRNIELAVFSITSLILPTLTGTLSSIPRYALVSLNVPIEFQNIIKSLRFRIVLLSLSLIIQFLFASAFFAGHFVS